MIKLILILVIVFIIFDAYEVRAKSNKANQAATRFQAVKVTENHLPIGHARRANMPLNSLGNHQKNPWRETYPYRQE